MGCRVDDWKEVYSGWVGKHTHADYPLEEIFFYRCACRHDYKYSYAKTKLISLKDKITVWCPIHGYFDIVAKYHRDGGECQKCRKEKPKVSLEEYQARSR